MSAILLFAHLLGSVGTLMGPVSGNDAPPLPSNRIVTNTGQYFVTNTGVIIVKNP